MTTRTGYDPRRSAFEETEDHPVATTREKELKREAWRSGIVSRYEERQKQAKRDQQKRDEQKRQERKKK